MWALPVYARKETESGGEEVGELGWPEASLPTSR